MTLQLKPIAAAAAQPWLDQYTQSLSTPFESFWEDHLLAASYYEFRWSDEPAGLTAVHDGSMLVLLYLKPAYSWLGQTAFAAARKLESVQTALVPSFDDHFISLAVEGARRVEPQAYVFQRVDPREAIGPEGFRMRPAGPDDHQFIAATTDDFYAPVTDRIARGELFIGSHYDEVVSIGISEPSQLQPGICSIGMFVLPPFRRQGHGTSTILALQAHCLQNDLTPIAGCWYYNHNSKKTLERAGMASRSRLFRAYL